MEHSQAPLFEFLCRMGDSTLILGQRLSEWCGHAPVLEEDIALANIALDLIGQTQMWLGLAGEVEGKGRSADDLAMRRDAWDFRSFLLVEQPNGDFGQTIMRQFLFDQWHLMMVDALTRSSDPRVCEIAQKSIKEVRYHLERSRDTVIGLGDGTEESHMRMQNALDNLWPYINEFFDADDVDQTMQAQGIAPDLGQMREAYLQKTGSDMKIATLTLPKQGYSPRGGKNGFRHSEHLGHLLCHMQWLQRAYPDASW